MQPRKQGVLIIRVSDPKQEREGLSLDNQERTLREYAEAAQIEVVREFKFQESADYKIRRRFREVISFVRSQRRVTCIVGYRVDRMTRNYHDHVLLDDLRLTGGKELHFVHDRLVITASTVGREIQEWDTKVYLAKQYLNRLKEDAVVTHAYKLSRGEITGKAPFGYRNEKAGTRSTVAVDEAKAGVVRAAFGWYATGAYSLDQLRSKIAEEFGLRLPKGQLDHIMMNPFYAGEMLVKGKRYQHVYERIITPELYEQTLAVRRGFRKQPYKYGGLDFTYRGLITCGHCGCRLTPERKRKGAREYAYYHCTEYRGRHGAAWIREDDLTEQLQTLLNGLRVPDEELEQIANTVRESEASMNQLASEMRRDIEANVQRLERRRKVLFDDRLDEIVSKELYAERMREIEDELARLARKRDGIDSACASYYQTALGLLEVCSRAGDIFRSGSTDDRRVLLKLLLQNCSLKEKTLVWELAKPLDTVFVHVACQSWGPLLDMFRQKRLTFDPKALSLLSQNF